MYTRWKVADLNYLLQGGQLYWSFHFNEDSLVKSDKRSIRDVPGSVLQVLRFAGVVVDVQSRESVGGCGQIGQQGEAEDSDHFVADWTRVGGPRSNADLFVAPSTFYTTRERGESAVLEQKWINKWQSLDRKARDWCDQYGDFNLSHFRHLKVNNMLGVTWVPRLLIEKNFTDTTFVQHNVGSALSFGPQMIKVPVSLF